MTQQSSSTISGLPEPQRDGSNVQAASPATENTPRMRPSLGLAADILLLLLIGLGIIFRFAWVNWSQGGDLHPDEYGLTQTLTRLSLPHSLGDYFNTRLSPLSPYQQYDIHGDKIADGPDNSMRWGQWPQIIIIASAEGLDAAEQALPWWKYAAAGMQNIPVADVRDTDYTGYTNLRLLGRSLSAFCDTLSLLVLFLIAWRLFRNRRIALLATALSALAVMQIQQSHFMTIDNFAVLFSMATMYCTVRIAQKGGWVWYALWGCFLSMTLASRINLAPLGGMILIAVWMAYRETWARADLSMGRRYRPVLGRLLLAGAVAIVAFKIAQPMTFRASTGDTTFFTVHLNDDWVASMKVAADESNGGGGPPSEQWTNRPAILFPLVNMVVWGMGVPLGVAGWAGLLLAVWYIYKGKGWQDHLIPVVFTAGMFLFLGTRWVKSMRYFLAIYPFLCLYAAWGLMELWHWLRGRRVGGKVLAVAVAVIVVAGTLAWAWGFTNIYRNDNTRIQASRWIYQNVPAPIQVRMTRADGQAYNIPVAFNEDQQIESSNSVTDFRPSTSGVATGVAFGFVRDINGNPNPWLHVLLSTTPDENGQLAKCDIAVPNIGSDPRGAPAACSFPPVALEQTAAVDKTYYLVLTASQGGPLVLQKTAIANESWDEAMPQRIDGYDGFGGLYQGLTMEVRWPDDDHKRAMFLDVLAKSDYIIMPSQRAIWSASRLPASYPMTMEYYRALFDGRLGFDLAAQFQTPIRIGPLAFSDLAGTVAWNGTPRLPLFNDNIFAAEEAFSVYDHAPVWIFRKRADFSIDKAAAILDAVNLTYVPHQDAHQATDFPTLLKLPADRLAQQQSGGTWSDMFSYDMLLNKYPGLAAIVWWLWIFVTGWAVLPILSLAFRGLPDEGYSMAKLAGWLLVGWAAWILGSFQIPFSQLTIALCWLVLVAVGILLYWFQRKYWKTKIKELWKIWLIMEAVFSVLFLFELLLRFCNSDLWHPAYGGEKPMEFAYINAVIRSVSFPPYDPWFAGGYLNYYYFGYVLIAIPIKLFATVPSIGFNLALPVLFGAFGITAFGLAWNLAVSLRDKAALKISPLFAGISAVALLAILGNMGDVAMVWKSLVGASALPLPQGLLFGLGDVLHAFDGMWRIAAGLATTPYGPREWYWTATREMLFTDSTFAEFPIFSFVFADLHAHLIAMPLIMLSLSSAVAFVIMPKKFESWKSMVPMVLWAALFVGALYPTNTWNYPAAIGILLMGVLLAGWQYLSMTTGLRDWRGWVRILFWTAALAGISLFFFFPYLQWYGSGHNDFELWTGDKTGLAGYLINFGLFFFILVSYFFWHTREWLKTMTLAEIREIPELGYYLLVAAALLMGAVAAAVWLGYPVVAVGIPLIVWALALGLRKGLEDEQRVIFGLVIVSLAMTIAVDIVTVSGDRMNTVFKFYLQAWNYFAIAAAIALSWMAAEKGVWQTTLRKLWLGALGLLIAGGFFYFFIASVSKANERMADAAPRTLDGMTYMYYSDWVWNDQPIDFSDDARAIRWMQENVIGSPVIVEANMFDLYRWGNRFSIYTGLPDIVGWNWHQRQQRGVVNEQEVWDRGYAIDNFYNSQSDIDAMAFLRTYDVKYVIVGQLERSLYSAQGISKFDSMATSGSLELVYHEGEMDIYKVKQNIPG